MKVQNNRTVQEILSETSIIRDSITANNMELTDFKRHSSSISQQMQSQLTDLREKLTSAFGEITALVKQKTQSDSEMMQDVNTLQQNLSQKTYELEALKKSYSQAHQHLQSSLIQMQNHLQVTQNEVSTAKSSCERVQRESTQRFSQLESNLKSMTEEYSRGTGEVRNQMRQLKDEIARIQQSLTSVTSEFEDHKRVSTSTHNKLQAQVWSVEEARKAQEAASPSHHSQKSYQPMVAMTASQGSLYPGTGSVNVPQPVSMIHASSPRRSPSLPQPVSPHSLSGSIVPNMSGLHHVFLRGFCLKCFRSVRG
ncbi:Ctsb [Symbiodinium natans]|uniref:Ctsb protein n=1 Tax=Symbiodinium natans TaxID=878477 RepID=A0A812JJS2_9DINO|nr:Ctsb [Symbiodinium natans]